MAIVPAIYFGRGPVPCAGRVGAQIIGVPPHHILFSGLVFILIRDQLVLSFDLYFTNLIYLIIFYPFLIYIVHGLRNIVVILCCQKSVKSEKPLLQLVVEVLISQPTKRSGVLFSIHSIYDHFTFFQHTLSSKSFESSTDSLLSV